MKLASLVLALLFLTIPTKAENAPQFKFFHVYYAVTNLAEVRIVSIYGIAFASRGECDTWRRADVEKRKASPSIPIAGEDYLILGSYCGAGVDI